MAAPPANNTHNVTLDFYEFDNAVAKAYDVSDRVAASNFQTDEYFCTTITDFLAQKKAFGNLESSEPLSFYKMYKLSGSAAYATSKQSIQDYFYSTKTYLEGEASLAQQESVYLRYTLEQERASNAAREADIYAKLTAIMSSLNGEKIARGADTERLEAAVYRLETELATEKSERKADVARLEEANLATQDAHIFERLYDFAMQTAQIHNVVLAAPYSFAQESLYVWTEDILTKENCTTKEGAKTLFAAYFPVARFPGLRGEFKVETGSFDRKRVASSAAASLLTLKKRRLNNGAAVPGPSQAS